MDVGIESLAVVADTDGVVLYRVKGVKAFKHAQKRLRRANQAVARTKPGSNGRRKARQRLARVHSQIAFRRAHAAHEVAKKLAKSLLVLTVEDLNVAGMLRNRRIARALADAGIGDLLRLLKYKAS